MPASKIVDEQEVIRWFQEGRTYEWMSEQYRTKYNVETVPSLWGNFRRRRGLARRITRDDNLIPWAVQPAHRWAYPLQMLRLEGRARAGEPVREADQARHRNFLAMLEETEQVVDYDPATGFSYVPRKASDLDIVRQPRVSARTSRHAAD